MYKRFLAILAIVTTVFAFGVGAAMADKPEDPGKKSPHPACEKENPPVGCNDGDGHPDDDTGAGEDEETQSPLQPLCDALKGVHADLGGACQTIIDALGGGGGGEFPPSELPVPPGGGGERPECADLGEQSLPTELTTPLIGACEQLEAQAPAA